MSKTFKLERRPEARVPMYVRLRPDTIERLENVAYDSGIGKAEIVQQALDFALDRLDAELRLDHRITSVKLEPGDG